MEEVSKMIYYCMHAGKFKQAKTIIDSWITKGHTDAAELYLLKGIVYSAFPECEKEASEAFELYNRRQISISEHVSEAQYGYYYSFRPPSKYAIEDLKNNQITLVPPSKMNDPFDTPLFHWIEYRIQANEQHLKKIRNIKVINAFRKVTELYTRSMQHYRIRSFVSWNKDDICPPYERIIMWSHYAREHRGFIVKYKFSPEFKFQLKDKSYCVLKQIKYCSKCSYTEEMEISGEKALNTKSTEWSYENESRFIMYNPEAQNTYYRLKLDNNSAVAAVIFGYKCRTQTRNRVKEALKGQNQVKYYEMHAIPDNIYKLAIRNINEDIP